eukprot:scaffold301804_cov83-Attheya_sp.AAC.1
MIHSTASFVNVVAMPREHIFARHPSGGSKCDTRKSEVHLRDPLPMMSMLAYLLGQVTSELKDGNAAIAVEATSVFCKVWHSGDRSTDVDSIKEEMGMLNLARAKE